MPLIVSYSAIMITITVFTLVYVIYTDKRQTGGRY